jgi:serine/threonine protein kinase
MWIHLKRLSTRLVMEYFRAPWCLACGKAAIYRCKRCGHAAYCSKECQRAHWPEHKDSCMRLVDYQFTYDSTTPSDALADTSPAIDTYDPNDGGGNEQWVIDVDGRVRPSSPKDRGVEESFILPSRRANPDRVDFCGLEISTHGACMKITSKWGPDRTFPIYDPSLDMKTCFGPGKRIGAGSFGTVTTHSTRSGDVAIKEIIFDRVSRRRTDLSEFPMSAYHELVMKNMVHPGVVGICQVIIAASMTNPGIRSFYMVMDKASSSLYHYRATPEGTAFFRVLDNFMKFSTLVARGFAYLHDNMIIHADVKPDNILIAYDDTTSGRYFPRPMIADFGLSSHVTSWTNKKAYAIVYRAPELYPSVTGRPSYVLSYAADVWALGVVFYEMATFGEGVIDARHIARNLAWQELESRFAELFVKTLGLPEQYERRTVGSDDKYPALYSIMPPSPTDLVHSPLNQKLATKIAPIYGIAYANMLYKMLRWHPTDRLTMHEVIASDCFTKVRTVQGVADMFDNLGYTDERVVNWPQVVYKNLKIDPDCIIPRYEDTCKRQERAPTKDPAIRAWLATQVAMVKLDIHAIAAYHSGVDESLVFIAYTIATMIAERTTLFEDLRRRSGTSLQWHAGLAVVCYRMAIKKSDSRWFLSVDDALTVLGSSAFDICEMEIEILKSLQFDVNIPTSEDFLHLYLQLNGGRINGRSAAIGRLLLHVLARYSTTTLDCPQTQAIMTIMCLIMPISKLDSLNIGKYSTMSHDIVTNAYRIVPSIVNFARTCQNDPVLLFPPAAYHFFVDQQTGELAFTQFLDAVDAWLAQHGSV